MNPIGSIERDNRKIIYLMNETMWLATDHINREQEITFFGMVGEEGVLEDCNSLACKMQSNLWHSQEVMECSDDGGLPLVEIR